MNDDDDDQQWEMENFGCTIPAMVRVRGDRNMEKSNSLDRNAEQQQTTNDDERQQDRPKQQLLNNMISNEKIDELSKKSSPFHYRHQPIFTPPQMIGYYRPRSTYTYQEVRPNYRFYY